MGMMRGSDYTYLLRAVGRRTFLFGGRFDKKVVFKVWRAALHTRFVFIPLQVGTRGPYILRFRGEKKKKT